MTVSTDDFRRALGCFASGVTVVTAVDGEGRPAGVTVSAFSSVSLDPPLVLFCLDRKTAALTSYTDSGRFAVNVLAEGQQAVSNAFASTREDRFAGIDVVEGAGGCPLIAGAMAHLECALEAVHDGGDHLILVGRVETAQADPDKAPLVYACGAYRKLD